MDAMAFKIKLDGDTIKLPDAGRFIGKNVIITIAELETEKKVETENSKKKWKYLGAARLGGKLDKINTRDFAHE